MGSRDGKERVRRTTSQLVRVLQGENSVIPPIWMMRQAGRYLPEYRALRLRAGSFLDLCYQPELATEVTLQPIERFDFDAAILFADILLIPHGLGQKVSFEEGVGPVLDALVPGSPLSGLSLPRTRTHLQPVFETVARTREKLAAEKALIGFCGAPWTVATYMIAGRGTSDQKPARLAAYQETGWFADLVEILVEASIGYLCDQIVAGCDAVQIFDTWAGSLPETEFRKWSVDPVVRIVRGVREKFPDIPVIGFPKGAGPLYQDFVRETGVNGISIDTAVAPGWAKHNLQNLAAVQGNLDPLAVVAGGPGLVAAVKELLETLGTGRFIFNLGHGLIPETPVEHVQQVIDLVRTGR